MLSTALPKGSKSTQSLATSEPISVVRRSYTQELLDMGIDFDNPLAREAHRNNIYFGGQNGMHKAPLNSTLPIQWFSFLIYYVFVCQTFPDA